MLRQRRKVDRQTNEYDENDEKEEKIGTLDKVLSDNIYGFLVVMRERKKRRGKDGGRNHEKFRRTIFPM